MTVIRSRWSWLSIVAFAALATFAVLSAVSALAEPVKAGHSFTVSTGIYRIPYANGTAVTANNDHHNHPSVLDRVDLAGPLNPPNTPSADIVAAASGIIRGLRDMNGNDGGLGDGFDFRGDITATHSDDAEHSCLDNTTVEGRCSNYNNYVWIEHPNGEWTKYTHFQTGSVSGNGWAIGDTIQAGQVLGREGDVGSASGPHLHFEVAFPTDPNDIEPFRVIGGFIDNNAWNRVTFVCFANGDANGDNLYTDGEAYTAGACVNALPIADAGGPYVIDEGSSILFDGSNSTDPDDSNNVSTLTYLWDPDAGLDDETIAQPTFSASDDLAATNVTLTVYDQVEGWAVVDTTTVTVNNVAPSIDSLSVDVDPIDEGEEAVVSVVFSDPGGGDTHTITVDWGDGTTTGPFAAVALSFDVEHEYGDNGVYTVEVTILDDDGDDDVASTSVTVGNLDPTISISADETIAFPGGDYAVVEAGETAALTAEGSDPGSDDLVFTWSFGASNTYYNDGFAPDPAKSPDGDYPFEADDSVDGDVGGVGFVLVEATVTDDDGGFASADANVIVVGDAESTQDGGWWKHQYSGSGAPHIDEATALAYLDIVDVVSSVFSEQTIAADADDVHDILSPGGGDSVAKAEAELMLAWLHFASGAVAHDATVTLKGGASIGFLDLMFEAEAIILDGSATKGELKDVELRLSKVRHAS